MKIVNQDLGLDLSYWTQRARYYSTLVLLTGIFILIVGGTVTGIDPGPHAVAAPPVFVIWSGLPIATGCLAILTGGVGLYVGLIRPSETASLIVLTLTILNYLWQIAVMALYQPPAQGNNVAALPIAVLITSQLLPAYFHLMRPRHPLLTASQGNGLASHLTSSAVPLVAKE